jgi:uroporphyrinogen III methyltransferase/synthase
MAPKNNPPAAPVGRVALVGAGPGDVGLLTVRGRELLAAAEVVVYDNLANERLLDLCPPQAELIYVGKKPAGPSTPQEAINELLLGYAQGGRRVVRLKGGDPFVFGRGAEEAEYLLQHDVSVEIVPGVSSAIAVPAMAGIPVTLRGVSTSVHIVTGHESKDKSAPQTDYEALARAGGTVVLLMAVANLGTIAQSFLKAGTAGTTPVAVIRHGTMPEQEMTRTTLAEAASPGHVLRIASPSVIVIGDVVSACDRIAKAVTRPLGKFRIALTRPADQSERLAMRLRDAGAEVVIAPTIAIRPRTITDEQRRWLEHLENYDWVLFTSVNGVRHFFRVLRGEGLDARALAGTRIAAIGPATAEGLLAHGIVADVTPLISSQEGLNEAIAVLPGDRVLIPRSAVARDVLETSLSARGARIDILPVYETTGDSDGIARLRKEMTRGRISAITFTSSSTAQRVLDVIKLADIPKLFEDVVVASIGPITSAALRAMNLTPHVEAREATEESLAEALTEYLLSERAGKADDH